MIRRHYHPLERKTQFQRISRTRTKKRGPVSLDPEILPPTPYDAGSDSEDGSAGAALAILPRDAEFLPASQPGDPMYETDRMVEEYIRASKAPATQRAYLSDWRHFVGWCEKSGFAALPAVTWHRRALHHLPVEAWGRGEAAQTRHHRPPTDIDQSDAQD
jgi:hypothetical protein